MLNLFILLLLLPLLYACNGIGKANFENTGGNSSGESEIDSQINFAGITSSDQKTDTSIRISWTPHPNAIAYEVYDYISGSKTLKAIVLGQAASQVSLSNLVPASAHKFRVRMKNIYGSTDGNTNDLTVIMNAAPDAPTSIDLHSPSVAVAVDTTPTVRISGVTVGNIIKVFTDSTCATEIASGTVTAGTTIDLTTDPLSVGTYTFYTNATNASSNASACSSDSVTYTLSSCPVNYILVPANADVGTTNNFCVAKYEMKNVGGVATSQPSGTPWVSITQAASKTACTDIASGYRLMTNPEWITLARNIEQVDSNWSNNARGSGVLARGHSDNNPGNSLSVTDITDPYSDTLPNTQWAQRRTHTLSTGEVIWDLSGNVREWVDWRVTPANKAYVLSEGNPVGDWRDYKDLTAQTGPTDEMSPSTWQPFYTTLTGNEGLGKYYGGSNSSGGYAERGAAYWDHDHAGVYGLDLTSTGNGNGMTGFRCVYQP